MHLILLHLFVLQAGPALTAARDSALRFARDAAIKVDDAVSELTSSTSDLKAKAASGNKGAAAAVDDFAAAVIVKVGRTCHDIH